MNIKSGQAITIFMAVLFLSAVASSWEWPWGSRLFVQAMALPGIILCFIIFFRAEPQKSGGDEPRLSYADSVLDSSIPKSVIRQRSLNMIAWIFGLFLLIWLVNFRIAVPLFTFLYLKCQARERLSLSLILTGSMIALIIGVFDMILHVPWPRGIIQHWLGL